MKKIKVKLKDLNSSISKLSEELNIDPNNIEIIVNLEENKETYKKLSISELIDDWDFVSEEEKTYKEIPNKFNIIDNKSTNKSTDDTVLDEKTFADKVVESFGIVSINELSTFIEAVWVSSVKSPNIIFGTDLFLASIKNSYDIVATSRLSIEHELLKMIIEQYYTDTTTTFNEILNDTIDKLRYNYRVLSKQSSLAGVAKLLYEAKPRLIVKKDADV